MSTELIIATSGVVIAACAFGLSIYQAWLSAKATRLSVRPHLQLATFSSGQDYDFKVVLENNGLGPAFIESFTVFLDNEVIEGDEPLLWAINKIHLPEHRTEAMNIKEGSAIKDGQSNCLLNLKFHQPNNKPFVPKIYIDKITERVTLTIHYTDGFGRKMKSVVSENKLEGIN